MHQPPATGQSAEGPGHPGGNVRQPVDPERAVTSLREWAYRSGQATMSDEDDPTFARGTPSTLTHMDELTVLAARGLDRFRVGLCPGEVG
eukprot:16431686-Heterocapsa_arctica.AAC.1